MESDAQLVSSEFPIGVQLGSDQETYLATESLSPCSSSEIQHSLRCVFRIIVMLEKCMTTKGTE